MYHVILPTAKAGGFYGAFHNSLKNPLKKKKNERSWKSLQKYYLGKFLSFRVSQSCSKASVTAAVRFLTPNFP
jgi:hypothetical protein